MSIVSPAVWMATSAITLANSSIEATLIPPSGFGSTTIQAGQIYAGKYFIIEGEGVFSTIATPGNFTMKIYLGTTVLASVVISNIVSLANKNAFEFRCKVACRTAGATGTASITGHLDYATNLLGGFNRADLTNGGVIATINTTTTQAFNVTGTWATANAGNTITVNTSTIEQLSFV